MCLSTRPGMGDRDRPGPLHLATLPQDLRLQVPKTSGKGNVEGAERSASPSSGHHGVSRHRAFTRDL
eukprot:1758664-Alexandrium_andersonii.AAC.1